MDADIFKVGGMSRRDCACVRPCFENVCVHCVRVFVFLFINAEGGLTTKSDFPNKCKPHRTRICSPPVAQTFAIGLVRELEVCSRSGSSGPVSGTLLSSVSLNTLLDASPPSHRSPTRRRHLVRRSGKGAPESPAAANGRRPDKAASQSETQPYGRPASRPTRPRWPAAGQTGPGCQDAPERTRVKGPGLQRKRQLNPFQRRTTFATLSLKRLSCCLRCGLALCFS